MDAPEPTVTIDYDIHGWLGLRLVDPQRSFAGYVAREFHPLAPLILSADPDVSLVASSAALAAGTTYRLGNAGDYQECLFGGSDFCIVAGGRVLCIPFESVGTSCEIRYTPGFRPGAVFSYVRPILQLSLLSKGAMAIHSAAMLYEGKGILFAGWAESGKTEAMLGFLNRGASFVSDKWTIVKADGSAICNFPTSITLRGWVLKYLPEVGENLTPMERWRLRIGTLAADVAGRALESIHIESAAALADFIRPALERGRSLSVTPSRLSRAPKGAERSEPLSLAAPLDKLFFLVSTNTKSISVRRTSPDHVVGQLADCAQYERRRLLGLYAKFKYAFPGRYSTVIEEARERELGMLMKALESKEVYQVEAPFPSDPLAIQEALNPYC